MSLNKVPVNYLWEVAVFAEKGYHLEFNGWQAYMVRTVN